MSDAKKIVYGIIAGSNKTFSENQKTLLLRAVNVLLGTCALPIAVLGRVVK